MTDSIFREGGPYNVKYTGPHTSRASVPIPADSDGLVGRECTDEKCSPGYFKIKPGTGITEGQAEAYCPYCRQAATPSDFLTRAQRAYAVKVMGNEARPGVARLLKEALGLRTLPALRATPVAPPMEEALRRDVTCPHCGLEHSV